MGYESKIIVVERTLLHEQTDDAARRPPPSVGSGAIFGDELMRVDLGAVGNARAGGKTFREVFKRPVDFDLYVDGSDRPRKKDKYGDPCKWATVDEVLRWLREAFERQLERFGDYPRARLLYAALQAVKASENRWRQVCVVHFGY